MHRDMRSDNWNPTPRRAALRSGETVRYGVVLVCSVLVVAGCSSGLQSRVEHPSATVSATAEADRSGTDRPPEGTEVGGRKGGWGDDEDWPRPPFAGMYAQHPEMMFHLEEWQGIVSIEPPCVYFIFDPDPLSADGMRRRLALSLPFPKVRFDESTQTLWSGDIPIAHGDRVLTGGNEISQTVEGKDPDEIHLFWDVCTAHWVGMVPGMESVEWYCAQEPPDWPSAEQSWQRICVEDTTPWNQRDLLEQEGLAPANGSPAASRGAGEPPSVADLLPPPLFGMHPYHPDMELEVAKLVGILSIEPAGQNDYTPVCAYLYHTASSTPQTALWGDIWKHTGPDSQPLAIRLDLPYPQVRFDEDAWTLWNGDIGPMATGDRVIADPISPPDFNNNGWGNHKQAHEPLVAEPCQKANARATVLDIQPVEHYCTHDPPARHKGQCDQAMLLRNQPKVRLTLPE